MNAPISNQNLRDLFIEEKKRMSLDSLEKEYHSIKQSILMHAKEGKLYMRHCFVDIYDLCIEEKLASRIKMTFPELAISIDKTTSHNGIKNISLFISWEN